MPDEETIHRIHDIFCKIDHDSVVRFPPGLGRLMQDRVIRLVGLLQPAVSKCALSGMPHDKFVQFGICQRLFRRQPIQIRLHFYIPPFTFLFSRGFALRSSSMEYRSIAMASSKNGTGSSR